MFCNILVWQCWDRVCSKCDTCPVHYNSVGMTRDAVSLLCDHSSGDGRLALTTLLKLLRQARVTANKRKTQLHDNNTSNKTVTTTITAPMATVATTTIITASSSSSSHDRTTTQPSEVNYCDDKDVSRIANYGDTASTKTYRKRHTISLKEGALPTTDDISSDEENEVIKNAGTANIRNNNNRKSSSTGGADLDNISDVSDNSVQDRPHLDSDDVLSDALSADDALDYEALEDDPLEDTDADKFDLPQADDEINHNTNFANTVVANGRLSTMLYTKSQQAAITTKKSCLKITKRPIKNKLLLSKASHGCDCVVTSSVAMSSRPEDSQRDAAHAPRPRRPLVVVITVTHVKELLAVSPVLTLMVIPP